MCGVLLFKVDYSVLILFGAKLSVKMLALVDFEGFGPLKPGLEN